MIKHGTIVAFLEHALYQASTLFFPVNRNSIHPYHIGVRCIFVAIGLSAVSSLVVLDKGYYYAIVDRICLLIPINGVLFLS